jgi:alkanesulfonate monooxygenase SsuD/methylene tetrahydromethanopterin reductase-like flavin-dependent oxidoreductase (luciferase family)
MMKFDILTAVWTGEPVKYPGKHYLVDDVQFLPRPADVRAVIAAGPPR